jgi:hypothetical protein
MAVSEAQKKATAKYEREKYDKILTRFLKGTKDRIIETGAKSVNSFIIEAVEEKLSGKHADHADISDIKTDQNEPEHDPNDDLEWLQ